MVRAERISTNQTSLGQSSTALPMSLQRRDPGHSRTSAPRVAANEPWRQNARPPAPATEHAEELLFCKNNVPRSIGDPPPFQDPALILHDEVVRNPEELACLDHLAVDHHLLRAEHAACLDGAVPERQKDAQPCLATRIVDRLLDYEDPGVAVLTRHIPGPAQPACASSGRGRAPMPQIRSRAGAAWGSAEQ